MTKGYGLSKGAMVGCSTSPEDKRLKLLILDVPLKVLRNPDSYFLYKTDNSS